MPLKSKKLFVDGRTYGCMYGRMDGHLRHTLLGRLGGVDLKISRFEAEYFAWSVSIKQTDLIYYYNTAENQKQRTDRQCC